MVLFTSIALKLAPVDIYFLPPNRGSYVPPIKARSTPNLAILATGVVLDIALIATLIITSIACQEMRDFWSHDFIERAEIGYPISIVAACIITYSCIRIPVLYRTPSQMYGKPIKDQIEFCNERDAASFLCFPARKLQQPQRV